MQGQHTIRYQRASELIEMGSYARYYEDTTSRLNHIQVSKLPDRLFTNSPDKVLNLGFTPSRIWLKWDLSNQTNEPVYAILEAQDVDFVDAYVVSEDTTYFLETGVLRPFTNRYFGINSITLYLGRHPKHVYIALKDMNGLVLPIKLGSIQPIVQKVYRETMINSFVAGVMALIALFSFFMYVSLRDRTFLLYTLHVVFSCLTLLTFEGYLFDLLWQDMPYMNNGINSSLIRLFTLLTSLAFSVNFLNLRAVYPRVAQAYQGTAVLAIGVVAAKIVGIQQAEMVFNVVVLITFLSFLGLGLVLYRRGFRAARFYLLGWGIYIVEILLLVLTLFNVISFDHVFTYYGYQIGAVCQATLLTFAVMDRINLLRHDISQAQELALKRLEENQNLIEQHNEVLEKQLNQAPSPPSDELQQVLRMIREERERVKKIPIPTIESVLLFPADDIVRIEAMGSYTTVHFTNRKELVASRSLAEFEQVLTDHDHFFKVHKSHLVNLKYITRYRRGDGGTLMMSDGSEVDVARRVKPDFLRKMGLES
ncbi:7TM diverse intracellular signaling domain-containing protein [Spirosoma sp.]|uniref:7TM diverse intracellular signaling domain-containing protein n=1 Tax=Spirosoma sp. TaxID=1899569 RepID=UPI00262FBE83|nr:7TM diverse intracellular signaling domain-containing protein [Spirosoma sp.]MCX6218939.1 LytTR family transcriptional regulator DNA-binding domain-containing protein [Spirosoma sp.]